MYTTGYVIVYEAFSCLACVTMVLLLLRGSGSMVRAIVAGSGSLGASTAYTTVSILLEKV